MSIKEIIRGELIGLDVKIVHSTNKSAIGMAGRVVDESRNMLIVDIKGRHRKFAKQECVFAFKLPTGWVSVPGSLLIGRPEDRIKKKVHVL